MPGQVVSVVLIALAMVVLAVGVFAVRQIAAGSRWRSPDAGNRRPDETYDWRMLPPPDESGAMPVADDEDYGPLWRYGVPLGYGRVYDAAHDTSLRCGQFYDAGHDRGHASS